MSKADEILFNAAVKLLVLKGVISKEELITEINKIDRSSLGVNVKSILLELCGKISRIEI